MLRVKQILDGHSLDLVNGRLTDFAKLELEGMVLKLMQQRERGNGGQFRFTLLWLSEDDLAEEAKTPPIDGCQKCGAPSGSLHALYCKA